MNLKCYFLLIIAFSLFFSCSEDGTLKIEPEKKNDATLTLAINREITKAAGSIVAPADIISELTAIVYNSDGTYMTHKTLQANPGESIDVVEPFEVSSGVVQILVVANIDGEQFKNKSLKEALALSTFLDKELNGQLTMSNCLRDVTIIPGKLNCLGFSKTSSEAKGGVSIQAEALALYRTVADVRLVSLEVLKESKYGIIKSFQTTSVFVANVKSESMISNESTGWSVVEATPANNNVWWWYGAYPNLKGDYKTIEGGTEQSFLCYNFDNPLSINGGVTYPTSPSKEAIGKSFYVYENMKSEKGAQTLLIVRGDITYTPVGGNETTEYNRCYAVTVNENGLNASDDDFAGVVKHNLIKRNTQYNISLTVAGPGSENPYDKQAWADINAKVKVAAWNVINMDEERD